jgi:enediyne biosynthesis protein E7
MQPSFHRQRLVGLGAEIIRLTTAMLERWQLCLAIGQPMDVASEMMRLTYTIVGKTLLGAQVGGDLNAVEHAMETVLTHTFQSWGNVIDLPAFIPTPRNLRFRRAMQVLDLIAYRMIAERRSGHRANRDLLSMLLDVRDSYVALVAERMPGARGRRGSIGRKENRREADAL